MKNLFLAAIILFVFSCGGPGEEEDGQGNQNPPPITNPNAPPREPSDPKVEIYGCEKYTVDSGDIFDLTFSWKDNSDNEDGFIVFWRDVDHSHEDQINVEANKTSIEFLALYLPPNNDDVIAFRVLAYNDYGWSDFVPKISLKVFSYTVGCESNHPHP